MSSNFANYYYVIWVRIWPLNTAFLFCSVLKFRGVNKIIWQFNVKGSMSCIQTWQTWKMKKLSVIFWATFWTPLLKSLFCTEIFLTFYFEDMCVIGSKNTLFWAVTILIITNVRFAKSKPTQKLFYQNRVTNPEIFLPSLIFFGKKSCF